MNEKSRLRMLPATMRACVVAATLQHTLGNMLPTWEQLTSCLVYEGH